MYAKGIYRLYVELVSTSLVGYGVGCLRDYTRGRLRSFDLMLNNQQSDGRTA